MGTKNKWLSREMVSLPQYLTLCTTAKQFASVMKHLKVPKSDRPSWLGQGANASVHTFEKLIDGKNHTCSVVCMPVDEDTNSISVYGLLVHEAVHVWQTAVEIKGEDKPSSEFEAYSIQSIAETLMYEYDRQTKRKSSAK